MKRANDAILQDLSRERNRLAQLDRARADALARIDSLRAELEESPPAPPMVAPVSMDEVPRTPSEKVSLFRSLFRGRPDVFPTRFVARRTGKPGYAPACANKFKPGLCGLRTGGKCGDCSNQAFHPVDDGMVLDHLRGRHVMGVYPLLEDETCWFVAVDFDGPGWKDDVAAFVETCRSAGVKPAIERSRSGNGAHAWFFFAAPVLARTARAMGCYLITETMSRRHELRMSSYDRLFPNQDTMPRGGFGNLIALPLQREPREHGNTVFVDEHLVPFADQWAFLASLRRMEGNTIEAIAGEATRTGKVVGLRSVDMDDAHDSAPWTRTPSGTMPIAEGMASVPRIVNAVLAQRLFVAKAGLPASLLNQLKRLAAFQNPEFYKKQQMRLSTAATPRVIACAEDFPQHVALPRGCRSAVEETLRVHGASLVVEDERQHGESLDLVFHGDLTDTQRHAARALLAHETGLFVGPPGIGKTVLGTYLIAKRARNALILVHRKPLLDQWVAQLAMFLGVDQRSIGQIGGGKRRPNGTLDVAMIQSLVRKGAVDVRVAGYGHVIVDECHHLPAVSFERVLSEVRARYVVGLTATPQRRDGHHPITEMQLGPVRFRVDTRHEAVRAPFDHKLIVRETTFRRARESDDSGIQELYRDLANDGARNDRILDDVIATVHEGRSPLLLTERKDHLEFLAQRLRRFVKHIVVLQGGMSARQRRSALHRLAEIPETEERLILATGRYIGEGFDDARLDTLFLALPISWRGTLIQYSGRLHRHHTGKREVRIYDYVDREVPMLLRMFEKRLRTYRAIGYARGEAPLGFAEAPRDLTVVYDEEPRQFAEVE
jgi:superfamily II DNA or RNA helicase